MLKRTISLLLIMVAVLGWCLGGTTGQAVHIYDDATGEEDPGDGILICGCSQGAFVLSGASAKKYAPGALAATSGGYTNSPLVSFTQISPNRTAPRNHKIDTITIHAVQGNESTVEALGAVFANPERRASCNYAIGYDGRIALICPESDRSWCSSSRENDHRAITIEVSTHAVPDYEVYPAAYDALVDLLVDICLRNGMREMLYKNDKSLVGHPELQNVTVHRWFADTDCPGKDLMEKIPGIVEKVNARLSLKGDFNSDSCANIEDVTMFLNKLKNNVLVTDGDLNGDGYVTISDVTAMLNNLAN